MGSGNADLQEQLTALLLELCAIDTTPRADLGALASAEGQCFEIIERELKSQEWAGLRLQRLAINPAIAGHLFYSKPYYTMNEKGEILDVQQTYRGRSNLVVRIPGNGGGRTLALNVHVDVVRPYVPPRREGAIVHGRGACDDKGPLVALLGALRLAQDQLRKSGKTLGADVTLMFVIEEEMGGNGSLSLAIDRELRKQYQSIMVLECCSNNIHPGNRGAVWYKVEANLPGANLFEASAFAIEEMEHEGRAIKSESRHELFPHRPVQTCHGVIGSFGEHPSRICGKVAFEIELGGKRDSAAVLLQDLIDSAITEYTSLYGDKTKVADPTTGKPKVDHHYDLVPSGNGWSVTVHGSTGHMGSILLNDGAITKMATIVRALVRSRPALERTAGGKLQLRLANWQDQSVLFMEGGQGFLPTHPMQEVMDRMRSAAQRGVGRYLAHVGRREDASSSVRVTYDKLHNAAFAGRSDSPAMLDAVAAAKQTGLWKEDQPVRGWDVSCDSRLFATEHPDLTVLTAGPGHLMHAHADNEQVAMGDVTAFARFLSAFILKHTQSLS